MPKAGPEATYGYMRVSDYQAIADNWEKYKGFTVRPLPSTQAYYGSVVDRFTSPTDQLMVYGGTPEIRTELVKASRQATLVDRAPAMIYAMGLLTAGEKLLHPTERIVVADWLNMPFDKPFAKAAFGDDAINMATWDKFPQFLEGAHRALESNGVYACHLLVAPESKYRKQNAADVIKEYEAGTILSLEDLASRINFTYYDDSNYQMGWQRSIAGLAALKEARTIRTDHGFTERFTNCNSVFACPPQADFESIVKTQFKIEEVFYPTEHDYSRFEPLYLLRKKPC